jgi:hypothetical protein
LRFEPVDGQGSAIGRSIVEGTHDLVSCGLFDRAALAGLIDAAGPGGCRISTMGTDPTDASEWAYVDPTGASGETILTAVERGRLWINVMAVDELTPEFAALRDEIKSGLEMYAPHLDVRSVSLGVLVSSPNAQVYYHVDAEPNMVWQIAGHKHIWVYPAFDPDLADPAALADIFAGGEEDLPYEPSFDAKATHIELRPGTFVCWPQNSPHRVTNGPVVNISLTVSYYTPESTRRVLAWAANRWFHRTFGAPMRPERQHGIGVSAKVALFRAVRKAGLTDREERRGPDYRFRVDPGAPVGCS